MNEYVAFGLHEFLCFYPEMAIRPVADDRLHLEGQFGFTAQTVEHGQIADSYHLHVSVPPGFPRELPVVHELGNRIPRNGLYHANADGSLCLGSRLRVLSKLSKSPTLLGFADRCMIPYLFAVSHKLKHGGALPFGELAHGSAGELADYADLLGLKTAEQAKTAIQYLSMKEREANKLPCPCGCGHRLGKCRFNGRMREFRQLAARSWFRALV